MELNTVWKRLGFATMTLASSLPSSAFAQTPPSNAEDSACEVAQSLDPQRLLRRLSLDLRGVVPSYEEAIAVRGRVDVPEETIDRFLASPDFIRVIRRYHESQLWPNIDQVQITPDTHVLIPVELAPGVSIFLSPLRAAFYRVGSGGELFLPCKAEPAEFDENGDLVIEPIMMGSTIVGYQEGYVEVEPYWAPGTTIKVCGLDAQARESAELCPGPASRYPFIDPFCEGVQAYADATGTPFRGSMAACDSALAFFAPGCGCGPNLRLCQSPETLATIRASLLEQELRVIDSVVEADQPYHEILRTPRVEVNGPIAHFLAYQSRLDFDVFGDPDPTSPIPPGLAFTAPDRWVPVMRSGRHSGILTTPGYLLRFQSNRGRAHRFYNAFECASFIPNGPLPSPFEACSQHQDLTKRCGCDACHKTLEPMASHWGRFAEYGLSPIDDERFPAAIGPTCMQPFTSIEQLFRCVRFYEIDPVGEESAYFGMLNAYVFRTPEERQNIEQGPSRLATSAIDTGRFATCTARKMWTHFMRRIPTAEEEETIIPELVSKFRAQNHALRAMVKAIVTHPAYRRLP